MALSRLTLIVSILARIIDTTVLLHPLNVHMPLIER